MNSSDLSAAFLAHVCRTEPVMDSGANSGGDFRWSSCRGCSGQPVPSAGWVQPPTVAVAISASQSTVTDTESETNTTNYCSVGP